MTALEQIHRDLDELLSRHRNPTPRAAAAGEDPATRAFWRDIEERAKARYAETDDRARRARREKRRRELSR